MVSSPRDLEDGCSRQILLKLLNFIYNAMSVRGSEVAAAEKWAAVGDKLRRGRY